jgi:D-xylose transport system substrate-binding protein
VSKRIAAALGIALSASIACAGQSEAFFRAAKAKDEKRAARIIQSLALTADFEQLDAIQARDYSAFDRRCFPDAFMNSLILDYASAAGAAMKSMAAESGAENPYGDASWRSLAWDLSAAKAGQAAAKDKSARDALAQRASASAKALRASLAASSTGDPDRAGIYLALAGCGYSSKDEAQAYSSAVAASRRSVLEYLFQSGVPLPSAFPGEYSLDKWKMTLEACGIFYDAARPSERSEFETDSEFQARQASWNRSVDAFLKAELAFPVKLELGDYDAEAGCFDLRIPAAQFEGDEDYRGLIAVSGLDSIIAKYFIDRKSAPFFKNRVFPQWSATGRLSAVDRGAYALKELRVSDGDAKPVADLWAISVDIDEGEGARAATVANYVAGGSVLAGGSEIKGGGSARIALKPDEAVRVSTGGKSRRALYDESGPGSSVIGLSFSDFASERWPRERDAMVKLLSDAGFKVLFMEADHDAGLQGEQVKDMVSRGAKVIIAVAEDGESLAAVVDQVARRGAKVIAYDRLIPSPNVAAYVSFDNEAAGREQAKGILAARNGGDFVLLGGTPTDRTSHLIRAGQMEILQPLLDSGRIRIVADQWVENWDPGNATALMRNILVSTRGRIDAVVASNDGTALGALEAMRDSGLAGRVPISGMDATEAGCASIARGELTVTVFKDDRLLSPAACAVAIRLARRQAVPELRRLKISDLALDSSKSGELPCLVLPIAPVSKDNLKREIVDSGYRSYEGVYGEGGEGGPAR